jgi:Neuraminidase (sialidase)
MEMTAELSIKTGEEFTIYHEQDRDCVPPDVTRLRDGRLMVAFRKGINHISKDGVIAITTSTDEGTTWGVPVIVKEAIEPPVGYRDPSLCELQDGTLILSFARFCGRDSSTWDGCHLIVMRSFDGGATWPEYQELPHAPFDFMLTTERCIELDSGRVLMPAYAGSQQNQYSVSIVMYSDDKGATWSYLSTIDARPFYVQSRYFMENTITQTKSGKLVTVCRTNTHMLQAVSEDSGATWIKHQVLTHTPPETQPSLLSLTDGTLLLAYGDRGALPRDPSYPFNIRVRISRDEGESWEEGFILRDEIPHMDMGYPTSVELSPGHILTVYWRSEPPAGDAKWPEGWQYWLCGKKWSISSRLL